jgi:RNA polymerase sigma factor (TIGR02999 family)
MPLPPSPQITQLLVGWSQGDQSALRELTPIVYEELRRLANRYMHSERSNHTLQVTALIHEAYLRLVDQRDQRWQNRSHFFGIAAHLMRLILVDYARAHRAQRRGGGENKLDLDSAAALPAHDHADDLLALEEALTELAKLDERKSRIVEMRFFSGLEPTEIAEALGLSPISIRRELRLAKAWLYSFLSSRAESPEL